MKSQRLMLAAAGLFAVTDAMSVAAQSTSRPSPHSELDVKELFASNCGFCHSDGGRSAGRGPQLMNTQRNDEFIRDRIKNGSDRGIAVSGAALTGGLHCPDAPQWLSGCQWCRFASKIHECR